MYRFALRPRWILGHVLVLTLVVAFASLGSWQLRRLEERRDRNALVRQRAAEVVPLPAEGWTNPDADALVFRRVAVRGRYNPAGEALVRFRSHLGLPGYHVLTPLVTERGAVVVNRGWIPLGVGDRWPTPDTAPPTGPVEVTGVLRASEGGARFAPQRPAPASVRTVGAVHLPGFSEWLSGPVYPLYLQLDPGSGGAGAQPVALGSLPLDDGPHLSYAIQWFAFALGAALGWALLLRQSAGGRRAPTARRPVGDGGGDEDAAGDGGSPAPAVTPGGR